MEKDKAMEGFEDVTGRSAENFDDRELGWDDEIEKDSSFIILPEGDYDFEVIDYERARHNGSEKLPPCNKAVVHIKVTGKEGEATVKHNIFLHSKTEGMVSAFFVGIGLKKHGEKFTINFDKAIGCKGRAKVGVRKYNDNEFNEIKRFYDPSEKKGYTPGAF